VTAEYTRFDPLPDIKAWLAENRSDDPWLTAIFAQLDGAPNGQIALMGAAFWAGYERGLREAGGNG
jgi:hypothetical protein